MKASEILAFVAGAAAATGITLLCTTDKGKELCQKVSSKLTKEEIDKLIEKLKKRRTEAPSEEEAYIDSIINEVVEDDEPNE
ncbi:MAG: YtxH domain-containing protein [Bacteroidales bacterium]|nr:YtxH domain-containing protein [Bacteroidales bacterium]